MSDMLLVYCITVLANVSALQVLLRQSYTWKSAIGTRARREIEVYAPIFETMKKLVFSLDVLGELLTVHSRATLSARRIREGCHRRE